MIDGIEGLLTEAVDRGEPLFGGTEDRGLFRAPVIGVAVSVGLLLQQCTCRLERIDDHWVGVLQDVETGEGSRLVCECACFIDRTQNG